MEPTSDELRSAIVETSTLIIALQTKIEVLRDEARVLDRIRLILEGTRKDMEAVLYGP